MNLLSFGQCCELVRRHCPDPYAKSYASVTADELAVRAASYGSTPDEATATQALYILGNITHWRGPEAQRVRANLKRIAAR